MTKPKVQTRKVWVVTMNGKPQTPWIYGDRGRAADLASHLASKNPKFKFGIVCATLTWPGKKEK